ncbi:MAG: SGNH/GDSL hydrolase family protein [Spirochaetia bacterium]|nr:SGNH/GDSL hydrolase family protein [Spirochaetia bacterium]
MPKLILGFGASSMQGVGDPEGGFFKRLEQLWRGRGPKPKFINQGIGGHTTRDMLSRLPQAAALSPDLTIVLLGCNDLPRNPDGSPERRTELAEYQSNLEKLFSELPGDQRLFCSSFQPDLKRCGISTENFSLYMNAARSLAEDAGWDLLDFYQMSLEWQADFYADDGMHASAKGHAFMAEKILKGLE